MQTPSIINKISQYLYDTKDDEIELKPNEFSSNDDQIEVYKIDKNSAILKEQKIICDNIIEKFLSLNDAKFIACLKKIKEWDFETCMKEFIIHYYLYIKNDNLLRQYIILHLDTIVNMISDELELKLLKATNRFNFENSKNDEEIQLLKNDLANKKKLLLNITANNFDENNIIDNNESVNDEVDKITNVNKKNELKTNILNKLKDENKLLEEIL